MPTDLLAQFARLVLTPEMLVAALATAIAGIMRGYAGFGTAITLAPTYALLWGPREGVPVMLVMEALIAGSLVPGVWQIWTRRVALPMAGAACLLMPFGSYVLIAADGDTLRRAIGVMVLLFAFLLASGWRFHGARPLALSFAVGAVSGLMKGTTGMSGPPVILYLLSGPEAARQHRANLIVFFGVVSLAGLVMVIWYGLGTTAVLLRAAALLPLLLLAVRLGAALFGRLPEKWFRISAYGLLFGVGLSAVLG